MVVESFAREGSSCAEEMARCFKVSRGKKRYMWARVVGPKVLGRGISINRTSSGGGFARECFLATADGGGSR